MKNAQKKIISASDNFGNENIKRQQGTTRELFDYLPYSGMDKFYYFFKNVKQRQFPFTNIPDNNLDVGESFLIERIYFTLAVEFHTVVIGGGYRAIQTVASLERDGSELSTWSWRNGESLVIKNKSIVSQTEFFNANSTNDINVNKKLESEISIQPLIPFVCEFHLNFFNIQLPNPRNYTVYLGCHVSGLGTIFSPKHTY